MNFINRAYRNVTRRPSKSILLVLTFFLIGNLVIIGLGVSSASESAKKLTRQKMRAVVTYQLDYEKIWRYADSIEDEDELNEFYENYPRIKASDVSRLGRTTQGVKIMKVADDANIIAMAKIPKDEMAEGQMENIGDGSEQITLDV